MAAALKTKYRQAPFQKLADRIDSTDLLMKSAFIRNYMKWRHGISYMA